MRRRLLLTWLLLVAPLEGCAIGGASDVDDAALSDDTFWIEDTSPTGEDTAPKPDSGRDAEVGTDSSGADSFVAPIDTGSPPVDTGPADTGCTPSCTTCGADDGCGKKCMTGGCSGSAACVSGKCVSATTSYLSPGAYPTSWGAFARGISFGIASEGASTIRYTLDGSAPGPTSPSGVSPVTFSAPTTGTTIKWYADNGADEAPHSFVSIISTSLQGGYGYVVENVKLDGTSPVVVTSAGATLSGSAKYQAWVGTGCPLCRQQLVYGIGADAAGCLYDWSPSTWPGASGTGTMKLTAPATAGVHKVRVAWALELSCADALTKANPLGVKPTAEIGVVVVK